MVDSLVYVSRVTTDVLRWLADTLAAAPRQVQAVMGGVIVVYLVCRIIVGVVTRLHRRSKRTQHERRWDRDRAASARRSKQLRREQPGRAESNGRQTGAPLPTESQLPSEHHEPDPHRPGHGARPGRRP